MIHKNDLISLTVSDMTSEGFGVARYTDEDVRNFVIFIQNAAVGDVADCLVLKVLSRFAYASIRHLTVPSPDRIPSDCAVSASCGGCTYRHVSYDAELRYKKRIVEQVFRQNAGLSCPIDEVRPSPQVTAYRNKVQYPVRNDGTFGFFAVNSHRVVPCDACAVHPPVFNDIKQATEEWIRDNGVSCYDEPSGTGLIRHLYLRRTQKTGDIMVCIVINGSTLPHSSALIASLQRIPAVKSIYCNRQMQKNNVILGEKCILLWGAAVLEDTMCGLRTELSPLSFYQVNTLQAEQLYTEALRRCDLQPTDVFLDLYCGVGLIGLLAAASVRRVIGIEVIPEAVADATKNAERNQISNAVFFTADASDTLRVLREACDGAMPNVIAVDPPRKGLSAETIDVLRAIAPEKIIYISCNPATQARDIALLTDYGVRSVTPFDMFPRTAHVENLVLLTKKPD